MESDSPISLNQGSYECKKTKNNQKNNVFNKDKDQY